MNRQLPYAWARNQGILITAMHEQHATAWIMDSTPLSALAEARRFLGKPIQGELQTDRQQFEQMLAEVYSRADATPDSISQTIERDVDFASLAQDLPAIDDLLNSQNDAPVIRMINALLTQALREHASDIHFEVFENRSLVRFRLDGELRDRFAPHRTVHAALVSRLKIMAQLDIGEKRLPQDGRISLRLAGKPVDVRVSTLPTGHGERVVLRLLDKDTSKLNLTRLGMGPDTLSQLKTLLAMPHGIVLVTGPTGSGKTTTLYAALSGFDAASMNIMTVEDPVEYELDGIGQTQVNPRIQLDFARALRAILRQDPDVIMIGEIRDLETAQIAVQSSLTGHLVLATLHTNDAASAITRLTDMGIEPFLLASSLNGVLAQRLVRKLCPHCKQPLDIHHALWSDLPEDLRQHTLYTAQGCALCDHTGYAGRTGIYELLTIDSELRKMVHDKEPEHVLRQYAGQTGMTSLREDALRWLADGETSPEEIMRITQADLDAPLRGDKDVPPSGPTQAAHPTNDQPLPVINTRNAPAEVDHRSGCT